MVRDIVSLMPWGPCAVENFVAQMIRTHVSVTFTPVPIVEIGMAMVFMTAKVIAGMSQIMLMHLILIPARTKFAME
jgi:hypothetical protein